MAHAGAWASAGSAYHPSPAGRSGLFIGAITRHSNAMPRYDFRSPRLFIDAPLAAGARLALDAAQANYLKNVMRLKAGDGVLVFNGRDGEWRASLGDGGKRSAALAVDEQTRPQTRPRDLHYLFAP